MVAVAPHTGSEASRRAPIRVAIVGATGYAGGELVRILARHPAVELVGLVGREREGQGIEASHPHLGATGYSLTEQTPADAEVVFMALPHGVAANQAGELLASGRSVVDLGPDFRLHDPADYPRWYGFEHPAIDVLARAVYGLPELHREALSDLAHNGPALVGSPGCYPTATLLALAPLARAGLIADVVVDAKSGVSGAGREVKPDMLFAEVNESVRPYGLGGHRHLAEMEQEIGELAGDGAGGHVVFVPHLIPMTRGILATCHVRATRPVDHAELAALYDDAYAGEPFVRVVGTAPATKHVLGSNAAAVHAHLDERTGRVVAFGAIDNLVKGAAGQAVQAFNLVIGLPETTGLEQLPLAP